MRKSVLIGVIVAFVAFLIAVAVYVIGFDYKIEIEGAPSDGFKVEYGETFELPKIKAFGKGYLFNSKKHEAECEVENNVDTSKLGKYEVKISASYKKKTLKKTIEVVVADTKENHKENDYNSHHLHKWLKKMKIIQGVYQYTRKDSP